jgi:hypothetical protein
MPYSYFRLSGFSGYGAGNYAPAYYEMLWQALSTGKLGDLAGDYLTRVGEAVREKDGYSSTANIIEATRLANALRSLHDGVAPTLADLHNAATATIGAGSFAAVAPAFAKIDVSTKIGYLPENTSQTPIQDDMARQLRELKLERFKTPVAQDLALDLRENTKVKSVSSAFLDLRRSAFLNRLVLLGIDFAKKNASNQEMATWAESWVLCWTPESEIQLVESVLLGDTIEQASYFAVRERLRQASRADAIAALIADICACDLQASLADACRGLQDMAIGSSDFEDVAQAAWEIGGLFAYGGLRQLDGTALWQLLQQLFTKACLLLLPACGCDDDQADKIAAKMELMQLLTLQTMQDGKQTAVRKNATLEDNDLWQKQLLNLSDSDTSHPLLCGFATSLLLERGAITAEQFALQMSSYLSPGCPAWAGGAWFEGLLRRNHYLLLSITNLWQQLDAYITSLGDQEFVRVLVNLRRSLATFTTQEKSGICDILANIWGVDADSAAEHLQQALSEADIAAISSVTDFEFGDLL